jgi:hypothetical protein
MQLRLTPSNKEGKERLRKQRRPATTTSLLFRKHSLNRRFAIPAVFYEQMRSQ